MEISFNAPLVAFLDLKGLCEAFVVLLCECCTVEEGILPLPPALNLKGMEARLKVLPLLHVLFKKFVEGKDLSLSGTLPIEIEFAFWLH